MAVDSQWSAGLIGIHDAIDEDGQNELMHPGDHRVNHGKMYYDDLAGQLLDPQLVQEARCLELSYVESKEVW